MGPDRTKELLATYRDGLLENTLPFWTAHAVDREHGGFLICLDRDGTVLDTDKGTWQQARCTWLFAHLYNTVEPRPEWLELARHGIAFLRRCAFDTDGRMFFQLTREGRPLRKRRYVFAETFGAVAFAAYARAANDPEAGKEARRLFELVVRYVTTPGLIEPKVDPNTRPSKGLVVPMITIATAQTLRENLGDDPLFDERIRLAIDEIRRDFMKPDQRCVMELVGPNGELIDHFDGRTLNPGHAIEAAWFILREAARGKDPELLRTGLDILDWMWARGWDEEYGGIFYFRDLRDLPVQEYWHDMKFWWPHNETIIATLMAWQLTGDRRYADMHARVHDWAHAHFPDREHGEWFGYLHRDGRLSVRLKGNLWKGPFHLPRMQLVCWRLCERALTHPPVPP